jgi:tetratricopeptide (TPR) repeat protein
MDAWSRAVKAASSQVIACIAMLTTAASAAGSDATLALQEFDRGNYDKTMQLLKNKTDVDSLILYNRAFHKTEIYNDIYLYQAKALYARSYKPLLAIASAEIDRRSYAKAQVWLAKTLQLAPGNPEALAMSGLCKAKTGDEANGLKLLNDAVKANDNDELVLEMNALAYESLLKTDLAARYYDKLCARFGTQPRVFVLRGQFLARLGKKSDALGCYAKAIALNPRLAEAYLSRARLYFRQSKFPQVIDDTSKVIALNFGGDQEIECLRIRASAYIAENMPQKAIDDLKRYLVLNKIDVYREFAGQEEAYLDMARAYISLRKFAEAQDCLARLKKMNKRSADVLEQEACIANLKGNYAEALRDYEKLQNQEGDDPALLQTIEKLKQLVARSTKSNQSRP